MKICLINNLFDPYVIGGAEIYVKKIADNLSKNHEIIVITTKPYKNFKDLLFSCEKKDNLKIYRFYPFNLYHSYTVNNQPVWLRPFWHLIDIWNIHSYYVIKKILKKEQPDIVHTHNISGFSTSTFSVIKKLKIPQIHTLHDYQLLNPWAPLFRNSKIIRKFSFFEKIFCSIKKLFCQSICAVTAPSHFVITMHKKYGFFKNSKTIRLFLGIEKNQRITSKPIKETINITFFGQLVVHKGIKPALEAFNKIDNNKLKFFVAGAGPLLKELQRQYKNNKKIKFFGFLDGKKKENLWSNTDILIVPSIWYENSPVTIYEGFKHRVAIIASDIGGIPELIHNNLNGLLFKPNDIADIQNKILELVNNSNIRLKFIENGYKDFNNLYTINIHMKKLSNMYNKITRI